MICARAFKWIGLVCCLGAALSLGPEAAAARPMVPATGPPARLVELGTGAERHRFTLRRPAGVVLLFRLTLPRGTSAYLTGRIGKVAGVMLSTDYRSCRQRGAILVCEQQIEWCPLPRGTWGFRLHKLSGPAGAARLEFVVGVPSHG